MIKNLMKMLQYKFHIFVSVWCWFYIINPGFAARILGIYPLLSRSHFNFNAEIMHNLAEAGHQITMISPFSLSRPHKNITIINSLIGRKIDAVQMATATDLSNSWFTNTVNGIIHWHLPDCRHVMAVEAVKNLKNNYDILFLELFPMYKCYFPLAKKLDIPVISTLAHRSCYVLDHSSGSSRNPAVIPKETIFQSTEMLFFDRLTNLFTEILYGVISFIEDKQLEDFFQESTGYTEENLRNVCVSLIFSNNHDIFVPRPMVQNVINIGGIGLKAKILKPLPKDLEKFINEAKQGVILLSLGTLVNSDNLRSEIITNMKTALAKIPQRVIWKWDTDIEGLSENILLRKWIPQKEILAHKNVVAFMSHCGLNSIYESIYFGKPLILLPVFDDQRGNAGILSSLGAGIYLNLRKLQEMELLEAVKEIIDNPKYRNNVAMLSNRFQDDPMTPAQKVVYWTEYVLRHKGARHLRWVGADMPVYQYFIVDIIGFVIIAFVFTIFLLYFSVKCTSALWNTMISRN